MSGRYSDKSKKRHDAMAKWFISVIGVCTILSVLAIIFVIFLEILPLFTSSSLNKKFELAVSEETAYSKMGPWFEKALTLNENGELKIYDLLNNTNKEGLKLNRENKKIVEVIEGLDNHVTLRWDDHVLSRLQLRFKPIFDQQSQRTIIFDTKVDQQDVKFYAQLQYGLSCKNEDGMALFAGIGEDGQVHIQTILKEENFLGEVEETKKTFLLPGDAVYQYITVNESGSRFYTLAEGGIVEFWDIRSTRLKSRGHLRFDLGARQVTAMAAMVGTDELAVAFSNGEIEVVALASVDGGYLQPVSIHRDRVSESSIKKLVSSPRNRTLFIENENSELLAWYSTNERRLLEHKLNEDLLGLSVSTRGQGLVLHQENHELSLWHWDSPHPEAGFEAFFGKIWYAGYSEPEYTWQSSSGSDDFEPKLSLMPLIYGSIKGALYAMFFSVPFAVFAALYTSVFAGSKVKSIIKPIVEMMSAIPTVVVGFLAALWLAPIIDGNLLTILVSFPIGFLMLALMPVLMRQVGGRDMMMLKPWLVFFFAAIAISFSFILSAPVAEFIDAIFFESNFRAWLIDYLDGHYDMRNSIIIGVALGFAVIPIVYTLAEDSISSVPKGLMSGSLALGATPWQTAWRVVLPAASPGIFAAVTLGLGRAVGETMIVLMATGNTPIMSASIFEGLRALSANIAVEMPEAPVGGTLYRTLFLSAGVLLAFTSFLNAITEMVRHRLSKNYSKL